MSSVHNILSLTRSEQMCLIRLPFVRYFSHHQVAEMIMSRIFTENMRTWLETILFADLNVFQTINPYRNRSSHESLNFLITSKTRPNKDIIATIEDAVRDLEKEKADAIRAKISLTLQNPKHIKDNFFKDVRKALKEL